MQNVMGTQGKTLTSVAVLHLILEGGKGRTLGTRLAFSMIAMYENSVFGAKSLFDGQAVHNK